MKIYIATIMLSITAIATAANAGDNSAAAPADDKECVRAGACGSDGLNGRGWSNVNKESSGCATTEAGSRAYDKGVSQFARVDSRSSSSTTLMGRYQRLCARD